MKDYRAYASANESESAHIHNVGTLVPTSAGGSSNSNDEEDDSSIKTLTSSYVEFTNDYFPSVDTAGCFVHVTGILYSLHADDAADAYVRLHVESSDQGLDEYLPEIYLPEKYDISGSEDIQDIVSFSWYCPYNTNDLDMYVEAKSGGGGTGSLQIFHVGYDIAEHTHAMGGISAAGSAHTHGITYSISETALTSPSVVVTAGVDGSETTVDTFTTDQENVDITVNIPTAGAWYNVLFTPNKIMRIEANAYVQVFLKSL